MQYYLIENSFRINGKNNQTYKVFSVSLLTQLAAKPKFTPSNKKATLHIVRLKVTLFDHPQFTGKSVNLYKIIKAHIKLNRTNISLINK